jgi:hypothetical protein
MLKNNLMHNHFKVRSACKKLSTAIDENPEFFKGLKIPPKEVILNDNSKIRHISFVGILLAFFVKVFH